MHIWIQMSLCARCDRERPRRDLRPTEKVANGPTRLQIVGPHWESMQPLDLNRGDGG